MKKAFYSKSPEEVLQNVYKATSDHKPLGAEFVFSAGGTTYPLKYPDNVGTPEFGQFSIFDGKSVVKHLDHRNDFEFRPAGLNFFSNFTGNIEKVEQLLNNDIAKINQINQFPAYFDGDSVIKTFLNGLSKDSDIKVLRRHHPYTTEDKTEKDKAQLEYDALFVAIAGKEARNRELLQLKQHLETAKLRIQTLNRWFDDIKLTDVQSAIADCIAKEVKAKEEGIENFQSEKFQEIGGVEWKEFIEAAEAFAIQQKPEGVTYPGDEDSCLFCHQALTDEAKSLIAKYWSFIKSQAEQDARSANERLDGLRIGYESLTFDQFPEEGLVTIYMTQSHSAVLASMRKNLDELSALSKNLIADIKNKKANKRTALQVDTSPLDKIIISIQKSIDVSAGDEQARRLTELEAILRYYAHKEKLVLYFTQIEQSIKDQKWVAKARGFNWSTFKTTITRSEKHLSGKYFNDKYKEAFNAECASMNGSFSIDIDQRSAGAKSNRQLLIRGKSPGAILSEGEQKIIAIADFLAEMRLSDINCGIIFDDPVTSLDDDRKGEIAVRLAKESGEKQVIIFTHDLVFISKLLTHCEEGGMPFDCHWVETRGDVPGHVFLNNAPSYEKLYRNAEVPRKHYAEAKKDDCPPAQREYLIKSGFTALRTCYEILVINDLLSNTVQRYNERVSLDALKKVKFDNTIVDALLDSYDQCCCHMEGHTHSDKYAYRKPQITNLNEEIERYEAIKRQIKTAKAA